jgi:hypothetical protein
MPSKSANPSSHVLTPAERERLREIRDRVERLVAETREAVGRAQGAVHQSRTLLGGGGGEPKKAADAERSEPGAAGTLL